MSRRLRAPKPKPAERALEVCRYVQQRDCPWHALDGYRRDLARHADRLEPRARALIEGALTAIAAEAAQAELVWRAYGCSCGKFPCFIQLGAPHERERLIRYLCGRLARVQKWLSPAGRAAVAQTVRALSELLNQSR